MRNKVGCEGGGENAAKPASKMGAVVGLSHGMARPVQKLRTKAPKSCSWSTWSWALFRRSEDLPTSHQHCMGTEVSLILLDHIGSGCTWMMRSRMLARAQKVCVAQCMQCSVDAALAEQHAFVAARTREGIAALRGAPGQALCSGAARTGTPRARLAAVLSSSRISPRAPIWLAVGARTSLQKVLKACDGLSRELL
jgi:hypothetical protein